MLTSRRSFILVFVLFSCGLAFTQSKKEKQSGTVLPDFVVNAQTVAVVIMPGTGEPVTNPGANRDAQDNVEKALAKWGRLRPVLNAQNADLVISVRKGTKGVTPTVHGGGIDDRPVILQPGDASIRIGVQRGTPPSTTRTQSPEPKGTQTGTTVGNSEDLLEVYQGHTQYPLDGVVLWRYYGKDGLKAPEIRAIAEFRKALEYTIQQQKQSSQSQLDK